jgi:hypothetical protein
MAGFDSLPPHKDFLLAFLLVFIGYRWLALGSFTWGFFYKRAYIMKGIYHDLGNSRIKTDTILEIRRVVKELKETKAQLTADQLQHVIQSTVYSTGSRADALIIDDAGKLIVKKPDIYYTWDVSSILIPTGGAGN